jgi:hypothetical protein
MNGDLVRAVLVEHYGRALPVDVDELAVLARSTSRNGRKSWYGKWLAPNLEDWDSAGDNIIPNRRALRPSVGRAARGSQGQSA